MSSILENVIDLRLTKTTYLLHIPHDKFRANLTMYYNHPKAEVRAIGSIQNAIHTHGKPTFHITRSDFANLIKADNFNLTYKGRIGIPNVQRTYCDLIDLLKKSDEFSVIDDFEDGSFVPILIGLVDEEIIKSMGDQFTIKLASNWHQTAIKIHQELKKTKQNIKLKTDKDKERAKDNQEFYNPEKAYEEKLAIKKLVLIDYNDSSLSENPEDFLSKIGGSSEKNN